MLLVLWFRDVYRQMLATINIVMGEGYDSSPARICWRESLPMSSCAEKGDLKPVEAGRGTLNQPA